MKNSIVFAVCFQTCGKKKWNFVFSPNLPSSLSLERILEIEAMPAHGEGCYMLFDNDNNLIFVFRKKFWKLNETDFVKNNEIYTPTNHNN